MYVAGALEYERPFLAPLYKFLVLHPRNSIRLVPADVSFILWHLAKQIEECRHYSCAVSSLSAASAIRVDSQASAERTGLGDGILTRTVRISHALQGRSGFRLRLHLPHSGRFHSALRKVGFSFGMRLAPHPGRQDRSA